MITSKMLTLKTPGSPTTEAIWSYLSDFQAGHSVNRTKLWGIHKFRNWEFKLLPQLEV